MVRTTVIASRDTLSRRGLMSRIGTEFQIVDDASEGQAAIETAIASQPELVVIDATRTDIDWVEATHQIRRRLPETKVAVIGADCHDGSLQEAAKAGASCYIVTNGHTNELVQAISSAAEGGTRLPSVVNVRIEEPVDPPLHQVSPNGEGPSQVLDVMPLTPRQVEVVRLMAQGKRNSEIADTLFISERTAESHARAILRKLRVEDRGQAVLAAVKTGIVSI